MKAIVISLALICVASAQETSPHVQFPRKMCQKCPARVSLVQLIAVPDKYDGQLVSVEGYLSVEFEDFGLYLSHDDYDHLNTSNGVWVDFKSGILKGPAGMTPNKNEHLQGRSVTVNGVFDAHSHGHMGAFAGAIHDIDSVEVRLTRAEYAKQAGRQ